MSDDREKRGQIINNLHGGSVMEYGYLQQEFRTRW